MKSFIYLLFYMAVMYVIFYRSSLVRYYSEKYFLYTALGDDISSGFGAILLRGFAYRINKFLKSKYPYVVFNNFAKPSYTSNDLLTQLISNSQTRLSVKNSKIITISIGANNLLKGVADNFSELDGRILRYEVEVFRKDWTEILYFIRQRICSEASIYVMNLYNPYSLDDPNYSIAEYYINCINSIINSDFWTKTYNYKVVDIHEYFKVNSCKKLTFFNSCVKEPFPSFKGCKYIAEAFIHAINS